VLLEQIDPLGLVVLIQVVSCSVFVTVTLDHQHSLAIEGDVSNVWHSLAGSCERQDLPLALDPLGVSLEKPDDISPEV